MRPGNGRTLADEGYRVGLAMGFRGQWISLTETTREKILSLPGFRAWRIRFVPRRSKPCKEPMTAGIRVIMLTGDHARTAKAIGRQLGLCEGDVEPGALREGRIWKISDEELDDRQARSMSMPGFPRTTSCCS
jgi:P-type Ca2+ transporter type 2C